jgi:hypothetical protein
VSGDCIDRHREEVHPEFDAAVALLLLMKHGGYVFDGFGVNPELDEGDCVFEQKVGDGQTAHVMNANAVTDGVENWVLMIRTMRVWNFRNLMSKSLPRAVFGHMCRW